MFQSIYITLFLLFSFLPIFVSKDVFKQKKDLNNTLNITQIRKQIKSYEKEYFDVYIKSSKNEELFCDKVENNIKSLISIKNKYNKIDNDISEGLINNIELRDFFDLKADVSFAIHNIDIIIQKLKQKEKICPKDEKEFENLKNNIKANSRKYNENIFKNILKIDDL